MIPHATPVNPEENADLGEGAAHSTALETAKTPITTELAGVSDALGSLPPDTRMAILAIVEAAQGR
jgi:hypothetical protein